MGADRLLLAPPPPPPTCHRAGRKQWPASFHAAPEPEASTPPAAVAPELAADTAALVSDLEPPSGGEPVARTRASRPVAAAASGEIINSIW
jgi:hypothetical protein